MSASRPLPVVLDGDELPGEDALTYDEGPPMESPHHRRTMNDLIDALDHDLRVKGDTTTYTGGNMAICFQREQIEHNGFPGARLLRGEGHHPARPKVLGGVEGGSRPQCGD